MSAYRCPDGTYIDAEIFKGTYASHDKITRWMAQIENGTDTIDPHATSYRGMNIRNSKSVPEDKVDERFEFCFIDSLGELRTLQPGMAIYNTHLRGFDWLEASETEGWELRGEVVHG